MKALVQIAVSAVLAIGLGGASPATAAHSDLAPSEETLIVVADEWCPINCLPGDKAEGLGVDLLRMVFEPLGYRVDYRLMGWSRALEEARNGRVAAVVGAIPSEAKGFIFPENGLAEVTDDLFVRADDASELKDGKTMDGRMIGVIKDYGYSDNVTRFIAANKDKIGKVQFVSGDDATEQNIRKLLAKRIDGLIDFRPVIERRLKKMNLDKKIKWLGGGWSQGYVYVAFAPAWPQSKELARLYDEGVAKLKAQNKLLPVYEQYGLKP